MGILSKAVVPSVGDDVDWKEMLIKYFNEGSDIIIPDGTRYLPNSVFNSESSLRRVRIPATLESLIGNAFAYSGLSSLYLEGEEPEEGTVVIPGGLTVGNGSFSGCSRIRKAVFREGVSDITVYAFRNSGLTSIELPGSLWRIRSSAFEGCTGLTRLDIPEGVTTLESWCFQGCTGLTEIILPSTLTTASYAFLQCTQSGLTIKCRFAEGTLSGAPWGATNATIIYDYEGE